MGERDAFGRERDEDTLAAMGWRDPGFVATIGGAAASAPPSPAETTATMPAVAAPPSPGTAPSAPRAAARRGRRGPRVMTALLFLAIVAAGLLVALRAGSDVLGDVEDAIRGRTGVITRTVPVEGGSLVRASALKAALEGLPAGPVELLRVAPDRIDARVVVDGRLHSVRVTARGRVLDLPTATRGRGKPVRVDPRAPARIVRTAARRAGRSPSSVSHLVLERAGATPRWQLFFDDGLRYSASVSGRALRRLGG